MNSRVVTLLALIWFPLSAYVMFRSALGALGSYVLLPAIPCVAILYVLALRSWRESWVAILGVTLVCFWVLMAVTAPYLPLLDPNKPLVPLVTPGRMVHGVLFVLGSDMRGRDVLSRTVWGCQRVLVWGITATSVAYVVGAGCGLIGGYLGGWGGGIGSFVGDGVLSLSWIVF